MLSFYSKLDGTYVASIATDNMDVESAFREQYPEHAFYPVPGKIDVPRQWLYNGNTLIEVPNWGSLTIASQLDKDKADLDVTVSGLIELITEEFKVKTALVTDNYTLEEMDSWSEQKKEALAYTADPTVSTPLIANMAAARGISVSLMSEGILSNATAYAYYFGGILGGLLKHHDYIASVTGDIAKTDKEKKDYLCTYRDSLD